MKRVLLISLMAAGLGAQTFPGNMLPGPGMFSPALRQYFELTDEQVNRIVELNNGVRRFEAEKAARTMQVQAEIIQETNRPTVDPMALGQRYLELEGIRREIEAERKRASDAVQAVLTPAQQTKAAALQEVLRMYGVACDAVANNLISSPVAVPQFTRVQPGPRMPDMGFASFLLGPTSACAGGTVIRTFTPGQP